MRIPARLVFATALSATLGLAACGDANLWEVQGFVDDAKQKPAPPLEPVPQIKQVENFIYDPDGRRSPFVMDEQSAEAVIPESANGTGPAPDPLRSKEVLEQYSLDSLRMVGTLDQNDTNWGLITSPDGILHRVTVGNYLGRNYGRVTSISQQGIQLMELINEGVNEWVERQASIKLSE
ncbi:pilus assembly protein PilP [Thiorhodovibrio frisius]|uniref:Tfp pilus assembly protein PilP n=1 Tax=Thiorhodovibrio frisius TaxID=631362 RepID=H8YY21_9GAMM|nr:pilus assembly protein PilP [Thiorhodovibrio frisius]EIC23347.1 Tfp pilus assembly protein PilP [Thiorhodovibrio frisius]WPL23573.1 Pilus assembly protein, PilP [Thiorhodovibrio frisius]